MSSEGTLPSNCYTMTDPKTLTEMDTGSESITAADEYIDSFTDRS